MEIVNKKFCTSIAQTVDFDSAFENVDFINALKESVISNSLNKLNFFEINSLATLIALHEKLYALSQTRLLSKEEQEELTKAEEIISILTEKEEEFNANLGEQSQQIQRDLEVKIDEGILPSKLQFSLNKKNIPHEVNSKHLSQLAMMELEGLSEQYGFDEVVLTEPEYVGDEVNFRIAYPLINGEIAKGTAFHILSYNPFSYDRDGNNRIYEQQVRIDSFIDGESMGYTSCEQRRVEIENADHSTTTVYEGYHKKESNEDHLITEVIEANSPNGHYKKIEQIDMGDIFNIMSKTLSIHAHDKVNGLSIDYENDSNESSQTDDLDVDAIDQIKQAIYTTSQPRITGAMIFKHSKVDEDINFTVTFNNVEVEINPNDREIQNDEIEQAEKLELE